MTLIGNTHRPPRGSRHLIRLYFAAAVTAAAALAAGGLGTLSAGAATHPARAAHHAQAGPATTRTASPMAASHRVTMVHPANRMGFGKILTAARHGVAGRALYLLPSGSCTGSCLLVWPRLVMPRGKTIPAGASCLGTKPFGAHHRLQVTYHGKRLFLFDSDSGTSVNGNGVAGFKVAKVIRCH